MFEIIITPRKQKDYPTTDPIFEILYNKQKLSEFYSIEKAHEFILSPICKYMIEKIDKRGDIKCSK